MVATRKPDGSAHICIDLKNINAALPFYMPRIEEVLEQVGKSKVLSKLDLSKGYCQVPMAPCDIHKNQLRVSPGHI